MFSRWPESAIVSVPPDDTGELRKHRAGHGQPTFATDGATYARKSKFGRPPPTRSISACPPHSAATSAPTTKPPKSSGAEYLSGEHPEARNAILVHYLPLRAQVAYSAKCRKPDFYREPIDELVSDGIIGLFCASTIILPASFAIASVGLLSKYATPSIVATVQRGFGTMHRYNSARHRRRHPAPSSSPTTAARPPTTSCTKRSPR